MLKSGAVGCTNAGWDAERVLKLLLLVQEYSGEIPYGSFTALY